VTDADWLPSESEYLFFNGPVSNCKSIVLALVFLPRIDQEGLHIDPWGLWVLAGDSIHPESWWVPAAYSWNSFFVCGLRSGSGEARKTIGTSRRSVL